MNRLTTLALVAALAAAGTGFAYPTPPEEGGAWLGVWLSQGPREGEAKGQVSILDVIEGSPAEKAGLQDGDVILSLGGIRLESIKALSEKLATLTPGETATMRIQRDGETQKIRILLGARPANLQRKKVISLTMKDGALEELVCEENGQPCALSLDQGNLEVVTCDEPGQPCVIFLGGGPRIGARVEPLSDQLADYFGVKGGVLVSQVRPGAPAEKAGIQAGDVLTAVDGREIRDPGKLGELLKEAGTDSPVRLDAFRRGRSLSFDVTPENLAPTSAQTSAEGNIMILRKRISVEGQEGEEATIHLRSPRMEIETQVSGGGGTEI
jgi:serine protease Do